MVTTYHRQDGELNRVFWIYYRLYYNENIFDQEFLVCIDEYNLVYVDRIWCYLKLCVWNEKQVYLESLMRKL